MACHQNAEDLSCCACQEHFTDLGNQTTGGDTYCQSCLKDLDNGVETAGCPVIREAPTSINIGVYQLSLTSGEILIHDTRDESRIIIPNVETLINEESNVHGAAPGTCGLAFPCQNDITGEKDQTFSSSCANADRSAVDTRDGPKENDDVMPISSPTGCAAERSQEDVKSDSDGVQSYPNISSDENGKLCELHHRQLKLYCRPCDEIICTRCVIRKHRGHSVVDAKVAIEEREQLLLKLKLYKDLLRLQDLKREQAEKDAHYKRAQQWRANENARLARLQNLVQEKMANVEREFDMAHAVEVARKQDVLDNMERKEQEAQELLKEARAMKNGDPITCLQNGDELQRRCAKKTAELKAALDESDLQEPEYDIDLKAFEETMKDLTNQIDSGALPMPRPGDGAKPKTRRKKRR